MSSRTTASKPSRQFSTKDAEIARLKLEVQTVQDNAARNRATLVDAHQRELNRARRETAKAVGALNELRKEHRTGLHTSFNRMMTGFERVHRDANASAESRAEQKTLLAELKASSASLSTSAGGIQTSADFLKTTSRDLNTLKSVNIEIEASSTALQKVQGLIQNNVGELSTSIGGMRDLSASIKASSDIFAKKQETILANDEEARASIIAMDTARDQMQAVREAYLPVLASHHGKRDVYKMLINDFESDRYDLEEERREFQQEMADARAKHRRAAPEIADQWDVYHAMVDSLAPDAPDPSPKKRRRFEDLLPASPRRPRFEQRQENEDSQNAIAGETLIEITSSPAGQDLETLPQVGGIQTEPAGRSSPDPLVLPRDSPSNVVINPEIPPAVDSSAQPPQDVVDRIYGLFVIPADWTQAKRDQFIAYLRGRYHGQTFDDVKDTLNRAATNTPRVESVRKCLVLHGIKGARSCVSKSQDFSLRANCPTHGTTANGLCLIIIKANDGVHQWSLTDRL